MRCAHSYHGLWGHSRSSAAALRPRCSATQSIMPCLLNPHPSLTAKKCDANVIPCHGVLPTFLWHPRHPYAHLPPNPVRPCGTQESRNAFEIAPHARPTECKHTARVAMSLITYVKHDGDAHSPRRMCPNHTDTPFFHRSPTRAMEQNGRPEAQKTAPEAVLRL